MSIDTVVVKNEFIKAIQGALTEESLSAIRIQYLGKKGVIQGMYASLSKATVEEKKQIGQKANELKQFIEQELHEAQNNLSVKAQKKDALDISLPGCWCPQGTQHLITQTIEEICDVFKRLGFVIQRGPEIEREFYNFSALNIPLDHPSRDSFDTFYLHQKDPEAQDRFLLLRSHTSPGQVRVMQKFTPPMAVVIPGKVYRPDAVDASHSFMFHQIEGLLVDKNIAFADLKGLLTAFCQQYFGSDVKMRFRPHFFPFTEPSAEVDIQSNIFKGKAGKWLEILGCGMVHPKVFEVAGYEKGSWTGLAFGLGVERIAMLKHGIGDIRTFVENDMRFLKQF